MQRAFALPDGYVAAFAADCLGTVHQADAVVTPATHRGTRALEPKPVVSASTMNAVGAAPSIQVVGSSRAREYIVPAAALNVGDARNLVSLAALPGGGWITQVDA